MIPGRFVALFLIAFWVPLLSEVRVWQGTLTLPTYAEGLPDENPPFVYFQPLEAENYPYTLRTRLTQQQVRKTWRTLELENEYLKCTVLPDLGGRIYSCIDKLSSREMFYANPVLKKFPAGLRGAWIAAGTEFNFPLGHSWTTVSPVDFATRQNADGSASIFVGDTERVYGMRWLVEIILRPGVDVLEQKVTLSNHTPARHRYYWWNNSEFQAFDDTRFYLPCPLTSEHGGVGVDTWPVNSKGVDMSLLANHTTGGVARFAFGCTEPFMGVYSGQDGAGVAHYADSVQVPGKKIWSWGSGKSGIDAAKSLTDNGSQYVELQSGLFQDQETFQFLQPEQTVRFTEYWMPLRGTGGLSRATPEAAVNLVRSGADLKLALNVYRSIPAAKLRILAGGQTVFEETVDLDPAHTFARTLKGAAAKYRFDLQDRSGKLLLSHTEPEPAGPSKAAAVKPPGKAPQTEQEFLSKGTEDEQLHNLLQAWRSYHDGLAQFPTSVGLSKAAGRAAVALNRFEQAAELLSKTPADAETHYYLGLAYIGMGEPAKARPEFQAVREDAVFGVPARLRLAELMAGWGDLKNALLEIQQTQPQEVMLLRHLDRIEEARQRLAYWLARDPADSLLRYENVKLGGTDEALWPHLAADPERVLSIAGTYMRAGLYADAVELLARQYPAVDALEREPGTVLPQEHPLVSYYRGFCRARMGVSGHADFVQAALQSTLYVFPNRAETARVLSAAMKDNPSDPAAHYLLGSWYLAAGAPDAARKEWQTAYELHGKFPGLQLNLSKLPAAATPTTSAKLTPAVEQALPARQALSLIESGKLSEAADIFNETNFPKEKQSEAVRAAFIEVRLQSILTAAQRKECERAQASTEAIGDEDRNVPFSMYGFGSILKGARVQYLLGVADEVCGDQKAARKRWAKAAKAGERGQPAESAWAQIAAAKLENLSEAKVRLEGALQQLAAADARPAAVAYAQGLLLKRIGRAKEADDSYRRALDLAGDDWMLSYLCRMALSEN